MTDGGWVARAKGLVRSYRTPAGKQALWNLIGLGLGTAVSQGAAVGVLFVLTHSLSPEGFGAVVLALNAQAYLVILGSFGLVPVVVRDLTLHPDRADATTAAFFRVVVAAAGLAGLVAGVAAAVLPLSWDERVMLWVVAAGNVAACLNLNPLYDAAHRQALAAALMTPGDLLALILLGLFAWVGWLPVSVVGVILLLKWLLTAALHAGVFHRHVRPLRLVRDPGRARAMARAGWPILVAGLMYLVPLNGGVILTRLVAGEAETAVYGLAYQIAAVLLLAAWLATRILTPHITGPYGLDGKFLVKLAAFVAVAFAALWAAGTAVGVFVVRTLLPPAYAAAVAPLLVLCAAVTCYGLASVGNAYLLRFGRERAVQWAYALGTAGFCAGVGVLWGELTAVRVAYLSLLAGAITCAGVWAAAAAGIVAARVSPGSAGGRA